MTTIQANAKSNTAQVIKYDLNATCEVEIFSVCLQYHYPDEVAAETLYFAATMPHAKWDYKDYLQNSDMVDKYWRTDVPGSGKGLYYDLWANIMFGYTGRYVGFDPGTLQIPSTSPNKLPYTIAFGRNDAADPVEVKVGMDLFEAQPDPSKLTTAQLNQMILPLLSNPAMISTGKVCDAGKDCFN